ncbi:MAG: DUF2510 domain-containing protein [Ilumatobacteraceae bacterium]
MQEFTTVSSSSYDPAALATKLNEKSADGWSVVSIVSTGGDVTAFLSRQADASAVAAMPVEATTTSSDSPWGATVGASAIAAAHIEPEPSIAPVAEPAGWGIAPEPAVAPEPEPTPTPAAEAVATPSVPAGWYADPAGRFELRYWDGSTWTEHVSRAGQQYTDPPVA